MSTMASQFSTGNVVNVFSAISVCLIGLAGVASSATSAAPLPEADCKSLNAGKLATQVFAKSKATLLRNIGDQLLKDGREYMYSTLAEDKTVLRLHARSDSFLFVDRVPENDTWFLPASLECIRNRLVFAGFYTLTNGPDSLFESTCPADKLQCSVEGEADMTLKTGRKTATVTLKPGDCLYIPRGQAVSTEGSCLLVTWLWSPLDGVTFDSQQCSKRARQRAKLDKKRAKCEKNTPGAAACSDGREHSLAGASPVLLMSHYLKSTACSAAAHDPDFVQLLETHFKQLASNDELQKAAKSCHDALLETDPMDCNSKQSLAAIQKLAKQFVRHRIFSPSDDYVTSSMCRSSIGGKGSKIVHAIQQDAPAKVSFFEKNTRVQAVEIRDGPTSPKEFFSQYAHPSGQARPVILKGLARAQPAYQQWRDAYLVRKISRPEKKLTSDEVLNRISDLLESAGSGLNGVLPRALWGDIHIPQPLCNGQVLQRMGGCSMRTAVKLALTIMDDLHYEMGDMLQCQLDGYARYVLMEPKYADTLPMEDIGRTCPVDFDDVDRVKYGILLDTPWVLGIVEPGDCIYVPYGWLRYTTYHQRTLAVDFTWNPLVDAPSTWPDADVLSNCSYDGTAIDPAEEFRFQILEGIGTGDISLDELQTLMSEDLQISNATSAAATLINAGDSNSDKTLSNKEILALSRDVLSEISALNHWKPSVLESSDDSQDTFENDSPTPESETDAEHDEL
ncbi:uncharacterized protein LOC135810078 [Sycon ciliatum]|uniref:uncharacterized protein LOC135810078 n=1 Tax=Sycon ciliatum TaxID=27933 RepID=UPI0031F67B14